MTNVLSARIHPLKQYTDVISIIIKNYCTRIGFLMTKLIQKLTLFVFFICTSLSVFSAQLPSNISPQQIEQFKKLPKAQQKSLAASFGVDFSLIEAQLGKSGSSSNKNEPTELEQYTPREIDVGPIEERVEASNKKLQAFGYDIFANVPSSFVPNNEVAVPDSYIIGAGDTLIVNVFGKENVEHETPVARDGKIIIPKLGTYSIAGMTFSEAKEFLRNEIQKKVIGVDVIVTLSELRAIRVFVLGEAFKPGNYLLNSLSTVTQAIFTAGGISEIGSLRNIQVKRAGKLIKNLDLYDLLIKGDSSNDIMLKSGDVVFIAPVGNLVTIEGQVKRPAIYELKQNETVEDLLTMAVGLLPSAYPSASIIERYNSQNIKSIINIDLARNTEKKQKLYPGDVVRIKATSEVFQNSITITGAVPRPGQYEYIKDQRVADLLPNLDSYLLNNADLHYSLIVRQLGVGRDIEVLQFSLKNALTNQNSPDNLILEPLDEIIVFSEQTARTELLKPIIAQLKRQARTNQHTQIVEIDGAVKFPATYPLVKNAKLKDLIIAAGGLAESAFLYNAELSRYDVSQNEVNTKIIPVNLNEVLNNNSDNLVLKSQDRLNVNNIPNWGKQQTVSLVGEFKFPGNYTIRRGETLTQLIERAGGFTEQANLEATIFTRKSLKALESKNITDVINQLRNEIATKSLSQTDSLINYQEVNQLLEDLTKVEPIGRLVIDLPNLLLGNRSPIMMENGDRILVQSKTNTVNVVGQVQIAGSHLFKNNLTYDDYIKLSGGLKIQADDERIYVIKANGAVSIPEKGNWFSSTNQNVQPGDTVVVPLDTYFMEDITLWQTATQILYQTAVALAAITRI